MLSSEVRRFLHQEIKKQLNVILSGAAGNNTISTETIDDLFPGMPGILDRPVMHPYGLVSRAPMGTISVTGRQGDHPGNRIVLGHRDVNRPQVQEGEVQLYNEFGQAIYLENGQIRIGTKAAANPAVLGNELKTLLVDLIGLIKTHTHTGNLGAPTGPTLEAAQFASLQAQNLDNDLILSQLISLAKEA